MNVQNSAEINVMTHKKYNLLILDMRFLGTNCLLFKQKCVVDVSKCHIYNKTHLFVLQTLPAGGYIEMYLYWYQPGV